MHKFSMRKLKILGAGLSENHKTRLIPSLVLFRYLFALAFYIVGFYWEGKGGSGLLKERDGHSFVEAGSYLACSLLSSLSPYLPILSSSLRPPSSVVLQKCLLAYGKSRY